jgi:hypothetical protein
VPVGFIVSVRSEASGRPNRPIKLSDSISRPVVIFVCCRALARLIILLLLVGYRSLKAIDRTDRLIAVSVVVVIRVYNAF